MATKFINHSAKVKREMQIRMNKALEAIGLEAVGDVVSEITRLSAVDTGRMRNSVFKVVDPSQKRVFVGTPQGLGYSNFVHEGTSKMPGRPFIKNAITQNANKYKNTAEKYLSS